jgi:hypothetical protein
VGALVVGALAGPAGAAGTTTSSAQEIAATVAFEHPEYHPTGARVVAVSAVGTDLARRLDAAGVARVETLDFTSTCSAVPGSLRLRVWIAPTGSPGRAASIVAALRRSVSDGGAVLQAASARGRFEGRGTGVTIAAHRAFQARLVRDGPTNIAAVGNVVATRDRSTVLVVSAVCTIDHSGDALLDDVAAGTDQHAAALTDSVLGHLEKGSGRAAGT